MCYQFFRFNEIQLLLNGEKLDQEVSVIEERFPDIFDMDTTQFDIIILQDQMQMLIDDEQNLDNLITLNEYVLCDGLELKHLNVDYTL